MSRLILFLALLMQPAFAPDAYEVARTRASRLAEQGQWTDAIEVLTRARVRCATEPEGNDCLSRVLFSLGYVHAAHAAADPAMREAELIQAEKAYIAVEVMMPGDEQVLRNLALVLAERGQWSGAVSRLNRAADADPGQKASYFLEAAEVCRDARKTEDAADWYAKAAENGAGDLAWPRLVSLLTEEIEGSGNPVTRDALLKRLFSLGNLLVDRNRADVAIDAYKQVIQLAHRTARALAEEALVRWADLRAQAGTIDAAALRRLPAAGEWQAPAIRELAELAENPEAPSIWWQRDSRLRRHTWVAVVKSLADSLVKTDPKRAARLYERAIDAAPLPPEYDFDQSLNQRSIVFLDAAMQLARLLSAERALDPDGVRFRRLEDQLFSGKAVGYKMKNLAATQKTHAVLGLIYAQRRKWTGGEYTNATFQLRLALDEAAEREQKEGILLPLPHLNELLSGAYSRQGNSQNARAQLTAAAKAYLDLDALDLASRAIRRAKGLGAASEQLNALESIAQFRMKIPNLTIESAADVRPPTAAMAGDPAFLARQHFKMLADVAERVGAAGKPDVSRDLYLRALESVQGQNSLAGTGDVLRLGRIQGSVQNRVTIDTKDISDSGSNLGGSARFAGGKVWQLPESTTAAAAQQVAWSPDLLLAAKVAAVARPETDVVLSVKNTEIMVEAPPQKSAIAKITADRLKAAGLAKVSTDTKKKRTPVVVTPP